MHKMAFAHVFGPEKKNGFGPFSYKFFVCIRVGLSTRFSLSLENEQADTGPDDRTHLARPNSQARTGTDREIFVFSF